MAENPFKKTRVGMGKSRVGHGFGTGCENPRFSHKHEVFIPKTRVGTGKSRGGHGFGTGFTTNPLIVPTFSHLWRGGSGWNAEKP